MWWRSLLREWWFWLVVLVLLMMYVGTAQTVAPRGTSAALSTVDALRKENAQLRAMLIGRDQALANCHYDIQKQQSDHMKSIAEVRADLEASRLNHRADALLPTLRQLYDVPESVAFDWRSGSFRWPRAVVPYEIGQEPGASPAAQKEQER